MIPENTQNFYSFFNKDIEEPNKSPDKYDMFSPSSILKKTRGLLPFMVL